MKPSVVTIVMAIPIMDNHFAPNLSNNLPATGIMIPMSNAPGSMRIPDSNAV
ncbi:hypothetical protein D3C84_1074870 [compost metagenome]